MYQQTLLRTGFKAFLNALVSWVNHLKGLTSNTPENCRLLASTQPCLPRQACHHPAPASQAPAQGPVTQATGELRGMSSNAAPNH